MLFYIRKLLAHISLFLFRGVLSDRDIEKLMGYHIFIYPFKKENLKPSSYNLTASSCAFIKDKDGEQKLIVEDGKIRIPKGKTAIIETQESIYVSKKITGTYHSKVKMVNKGIGHIGTTLDPCFFGVSAIALHNVSEEMIEIGVGDTIVTLMFYTLRRKSTGLHDNMSGRTDDDLKLGVKNFYEFEKEKNIKIIDRNISRNCEMNEEFIKENVELLEGKEKNFKNENIEVIIVTGDDINCEKCQNCVDKEKCTFKILKLKNEEDEKKKEIIETIKNWKTKPWITSKESLMNKVRDEVKRKNSKKDVIIYSLMTLVIAVVIFVVAGYVMVNNGNTNIQKLCETIMTTTVPTATIIIGFIKYRSGKEEGEE